MNDNDIARAARVAARQSDDAARVKRNARRLVIKAHHAGVARLGRAHKCSYCAK